MGRRSKTDQELGYVTAFWQECDDMNREEGRLITLEVVPTLQKGVFVFMLSATEKPDADKEVPRHDRISQRFPSGRDETLSGFLWSLARRLHDQVTNVEDRAALAGKE